VASFLGTIARRCARMDTCLVGSFSTVKFRRRPSQGRQKAPGASGRGSCAMRRRPSRIPGGPFVVAEIEPPHGLTAGLLDPERFGVFDDGPGQRETSVGHCPGLPRPSSRLSSVAVMEWRVGSRRMGPGCLKTFSRSVVSFRRCKKCQRWEELSSQAAMAIHRSRGTL
jgi:hypothetical protein